MNDFNAYKRIGEPDKYEKAENWEVATGLQAVDGLKPSKYLIELAKKNIEGELTIEEIKKSLKSYYAAKPTKDTGGERDNEADTVSAHIAELLEQKTFTLSPVEYIEIHRRLFKGIYTHAGVLRNYNITKKEWVLNGDTVHYASATILTNALDYDFEKEKKFNYKGLSKRQIVEHIAEFTTSIWQIHPFSEGNTRTTAVFIIKYLRSLGFNNLTNNLFAENSWYFRNALVRAAATNVIEDIYPDRIYLDRFFGNLLLGENHTLRNRDLRVDTSENATVNDENATVKSQNATVKMSDTQSDILKLLNSNPKLTALDISQELKRDITTIKRAIRNLKEKGLLERVGSDKAGYWKIKV